MMRFPHSDLKAVARTNKGSLQVPRTRPHQKPAGMPQALLGTKIPIRKISEQIAIEGAHSASVPISGMRIPSSPPSQKPLLYLKPEHAMPASIPASTLKGPSSAPPEKSLPVLNSEPSMATSVPTISFMVPPRAKTQKPLPVLEQKLDMATASVPTTGLKVPSYIPSPKPLPVLKPELAMSTTSTLTTGLKVPLCVLPQRFLPLLEPDSAMAATGARTTDIKTLPGVPLEKPLPAPKPEMAVASTSIRATGPKVPSCAPSQKGIPGLKQEPGMVTTSAPTTAYKAPPYVPTQNYLPVLGPQLAIDTTRVRMTASKMPSCDPHQKHLPVLEHRVGMAITSAPTTDFKVPSCAHHEKLHPVLKPEVGLPITGFISLEFGPPTSAPPQRPLPLRPQQGMLESLPSDAHVCCCKCSVTSPSWQLPGVLVTRDANRNPPQSEQKDKKNIDTPITPCTTIPMTLKEPKSTAAIPRSGHQKSAPVKQSVPVKSTTPAPATSHLQKPPCIDGSNIYAAPNTKPLPKLRINPTLQAEMSSSNGAQPHFGPEKKTTHTPAKDIDDVKGVNAVKNINVANLKKDIKVAKDFPRPNERVASPKTADPDLVVNTYIKSGMVDQEPDSKNNKPDKYSSVERAQVKTRGVRRPRKAEPVGESYLNFSYPFVQMPYDEAGAVSTGSDARIRQSLRSRRMHKFSQEFPNLNRPMLAGTMSGPPPLTPAVANPTTNGAGNMGSGRNWSTVSNPIDPAEASQQRLRKPACEPHKPAYAPNKQACAPHKPACVVRVCESTSAMSAPRSPVKPAGVTIRLVSAESEPESEPEPEPEPEPEYKEPIMRNGTPDDNPGESYLHRYQHQDIPKFRMKNIRRISSAPGVTTFAFKNPRPFSFENVREVLDVRVLTPDLDSNISSCATEDRFSEYSMVEPEVRTHNQSRPMGRRFPNAPSSVDDDELQHYSVIEPETYTHHPPPLKGKQSYYKSLRQAFIASDPTEQTTSSFSVREAMGKIMNLLPGNRKASRESRKVSDAVKDGTKKRMVSGPKKTFLRPTKGFWSSYS